MLTIDQFMALRGEFSPTFGAEGGPAKIQAALDAAELRTDPAHYGSLTDQAHMWLTAHLLSADPHGRDARLVGRKAQETTLYMRERMALDAICGAAWGVGDD